MAGRKRGRPRTIMPFFADSESEQLRLDHCTKEGRDPYPPYRHEPCAAELELRHDVMPGVSFNWVLHLNDSYCDGFPPFKDQLDEAQAERQNAARSGGEARPTVNLAAEIVAAESDYIRAKKVEGWNRSRVINGIKARRAGKGQKCPGRSEMYEQIRASGLWD